MFKNYFLYVALFCGLLIFLTFIKFKKEKFVFFISENNLSGMNHSIQISKDEKFIIAPHTIDHNSILKLKKSLKKETILYSEKEGKNLSEYTVFIIDTIGLLTKIYSYADAAYVGGGFRTGLHNILEPATFGIPVVIGPVYNKFKEAVDLVNLGGCISVGNQSAFSNTFNKLKNDIHNATIGVFVV